MARTSSLTRPTSGRMLVGVCRGLSNRFGIDVTIVRLIFVAFAFVGAGELAYIILWILMPKSEV